MTNYLDELFSLQRRDDEVSTGLVPEGFGQGRTLFGGLQGALVMRAARLHRPALVPSSMNATLIRPVATGPITVKSEVLREGRSTTFVQVDLEQQDELRARATVMLTVVRDHAVTCSAELEGFPEVDSLTDFPFVPGLSPEYLQHVQMRQAVGDVPFSGSTHRRFGGYARYRVAMQGWDAAVTMADTWPPAVLPMCKGPTAASTAQWSLHLTGAAESAKAHEWFAVDAHVEAASRGVAATSARVFQDGQLLATSRQSALVY